MFLAIKEQGGLERIYVGTTDYRMSAVQENAPQSGGSIAWSYVLEVNGVPTSELPTVPAIADLDWNADRNVEVVFAATSLSSGHVYAITDLGASYAVFWTHLIGPTPNSVAVGLLGSWGPYNACLVFISDFAGSIYTLRPSDGSEVGSCVIATGLMFKLTSSPAVGPIRAPNTVLGAPGWVFVTGNNATTGDGLLYAFGFWY